LLLAAAAATVLLNSLSIPFLYNDLTAVVANESIRRLSISFTPRRPRHRLRDAPRHATRGRRLRARVAMTPRNPNARRHLANALLETRDFDVPSLRRAERSR
jgi:hypothetical protein